MLNNPHGTGRLTPVFQMGTLMIPLTACIQLNESVPRVVEIKLKPEVRLEVIEK